MTVSSLFVCCPLGQAVDTDPDATAEERVKAYLTQLVEFRFCKCAILLFQPESITSFSFDTCLPRESMKHGSTVVSMTPVLPFRKQNKGP